VGADRKTADRVAAGIAATGKPVEVVALDDVHEDSRALSERGAAAPHARGAGRAVRRRGMRPFGRDLGAWRQSAGRCRDRPPGRCRRQGGVRRDHRMAGRRAATPEIGRALVAAVARREAAVAATGFDLTGNNPGQENIRGGLSTIEEKSLGAIAKGGTRPIQGVLAIGEEPAAPGLHVMDAPAFSPESLTGFAASGAALMLFTTGAGNSFCNALAPTLKISVRPDTCAQLPHQIDFDGSDILAGRIEIAAAGRRLLDLIRATASGDLTWGEILDEGEETFIRTGGSL
ncbi:MAG: hypothetical protein FJX21_17925, partial [Alphaproteobacteria bacterium]|nr:hypothetical protein [Alphaproteobacteria bacterium]